MSTTMMPPNYTALYNSCQLTTDSQKLATLDLICNVTLAYRSRYETVQKKTQVAYGVAVPWPLIAVIHFRETSQNFGAHLHNGDPLGARTKHVPVGRPVEGTPPFLWEESAVDAFKDLWAPDYWEIESTCLEFLERYNGLGYQRHGVNSPYLWDFTDQYTSGLFVADGKFDPDKKENRPGCVALLKTLEAKGVSLDFSALATGGHHLH